MNCEQATKAISDEQERKLSLSEKAALTGHLLICSHCRNFKQNCEQMHKLMKDFAENTDK